MSLTPEQLSELREVLLTERRRIVGNVLALHAEFGETMTQESDENGLETHLADQGTMTFLRAHDLSIEAHEEHLVEEIDAALQRMDAGTYGICEVDKTPIDIERLRAMPWARTHLEHAPA